MSGEGDGMVQWIVSWVWWVLFPLRWMYSQTIGRVVSSVLEIWTRISGHVFTAVKSVVATAAFVCMLIAAGIVIIISCCVASYLLLAWYREDPVVREVRFDFCQPDTAPTSVVNLLSPQHQSFLHELGRERRSAQVHYEWTHSSAPETSDLHSSPQKAESPSSGTTATLLTSKSRASVQYEVMDSLNSAIERQSSPDGLPALPSDPVHRWASSGRESIPHNVYESLLLQPGELYTVRLQMEVADDPHITDINMVHAQASVYVQSRVGRPPTAQQLQAALQQEDRAPRRASLVDRWVRPMVGWLWSSLLRPVMRNGWGYLQQVCVCSAQVSFRMLRALVQSTVYGGCAFLRGALWYMLWGLTHVWRLFAVPVYSEVSQYPADVWRSGAAHSLRLGVAMPITAWVQIALHGPLVHEEPTLDTPLTALSYEDWTDPRRLNGELWGLCCGPGTVADHAAGQWACHLLRLTDAAYRSAPWTQHVEGWLATIHDEAGSKTPATAPGTDSAPASGASSTPGDGLFSGTALSSLGQSLTRACLSAERSLSAGERDQEEHAAIHGDGQRPERHAGAEDRSDVSVYSTCVFDDRAGPRWTADPAEPKRHGLFYSAVDAVYSIGHQWCDPPDWAGVLEPLRDITQARQGAADVPSPKETLPDTPATDRNGGHETMQAEEGPPEPQVTAVLPDATAGATDDSLNPAPAATFWHSLYAHAHRSMILSPRTDTMAPGNAVYLDNNRLVLDEYYDTDPQETGWGGLVVSPASLGHDAHHHSPNRPVSLFWMLTGYRLHWRLLPAFDTLLYLLYPQHSTSSPFVTSQLGMSEGQTQWGGYGSAYTLPPLPRDMPGAGGGAGSRVVCWAQPYAMDGSHTVKCVARDQMAAGEAVTAGNPAFSADAQFVYTDHMIQNRFDSPSGGTGLPLYSPEAGSAGFLLAHSVQSKTAHYRQRYLDWTPAYQRSLTVRDHGWFWGMLVHYTLVLWQWTWLLLSRAVQLVTWPCRLLTQAVTFVPRLVGQFWYALGCWVLRVANHWGAVVSGQTSWFAGHPAAPHHQRTGGVSVVTSTVTLFEHLHVPATAYLPLSHLVVSLNPTTPGTQHHRSRQPQGNQTWTMPAANNAFHTQQASTPPTPAGAQQPWQWPTASPQLVRDLTEGALPGFHRPPRVLAARVFFYKELGGLRFLLKEHFWLVWGVLAVTLASVSAAAWLVTLGGIGVGVYRYSNQDSGEPGGYYTETPSPSVSPDGSPQPGRWARDADGDDGWLPPPVAGLAAEHPAPQDADAAALFDPDWLVQSDSDQSSLGSVGYDSVEPRAPLQPEMGEVQARGAGVQMGGGSTETKSAPTDGQDRDDVLWQMSMDNPSSTDADHANGSAGRRRDGDVTVAAGADRDSHTGANQSSHSGPDDDRSSSVSGLSERLQEEMRSNSYMKEFLRA